MRISFKRIYGPSKLRYDLFGQCPFGGSDATDRFDQILLRSGSHDAMYWTQPGTGAKGIFIRNRWIMDRQLEMGQPAPRGRFVHLYINGEYWGQYHLMERPNGQFMAAYFGGDKEDYDAYKGDYGNLNILNGNPDAWWAMLDTTDDYQQLQQYMDVVNYADYLLVNYYVGNDWDWKSYQNWIAARKRQDGAGFKFFCWDNDVIMRTGYNANVINKGGPGNMAGAVKQHEEFRLLLADRAQKYYFNNGLFTHDRVTAQLDELAGQIEKTIIPECARWGIPQSYTPDTWQTALDWVTGWIEQRTEIVIQQMRDANVFPDINAPAFSPQGGEIASDELLSMTTDTGEIYYTTDGNDPRQPTTLEVDGTTLVEENADKRVLVPTEDIGTSWYKDVDFNDSNWLTCTGEPGGVGYEEASGSYRNHFTLDVNELMYNIIGSCYIRIPFTVSAEDLAGFNFLELRIKYDDGFVAYINRVEADGRNDPETLAWNSRASDSHSDSQAVLFENIDISDHLGALQAGDNILAIHGLNRQLNSTDFLISTKLVAGEQTLIGDFLSPSAVKYTEPFSLGASTHVKARVLSGSTWSALNEAVFAVGPVAEGLRITEIMYHPQNTGDPDDPNREFIELKNIGQTDLNLSLVSFTNGVDFTFPNRLLAAGKFVLIVKDQAAFDEQYPGLSELTAGEYTGNLDNAGERIRLQDALGQPIHDFKYKDGWYRVTDGGGFSLTHRDPCNIDPCDWGIKSSWGAGTYRGGSPGKDDFGPKVGDILINEILAHSDTEPNDWIELYNPTDKAVDISGWFLSDSDNSEPNLMKYQIPANTIIGSDQYKVFTEAQFGDQNDPNCHVAFALSENGESLYLSSGIPGELTLTGFRDEREFRASDPDVAFGLYTKSDLAALAGDPTDFTAMSQNTKGLPNIYPPVVGPVVIAEIMYHPAGSDDPELEYIKLVNTSGSEIPLQRYYPDEGGIYVQWKFTDGIRYTFPADKSIDDYLYVVYDKAAFSSAYPGVPSGKIFGPFENDDEGEHTKLSNSGEDLELSKPGDKDEQTDERFYILVDRVEYSDGGHERTGYIDPWPTKPDGGGSALSRIDLDKYGNDPNNWEAANPSPGG